MADLRPRFKGGLLLPQLFADAIPVLDVLQLQCEEVVEQPLCFSSVVALLSKARDPFFLLRNMPLTKRHMALRFCQVVMHKAQVHERSLRPAQPVS